MYARRLDGTPDMEYSAATAIEGCIRLPGAVVGGAGFLILPLHQQSAAFHSAIQSGLFCRPVLPHPCDLHRVHEQSPEETAHEPKPIHDETTMTGQSSPNSMSSTAAPDTPNPPDGSSAASGATSSLPRLGRPHPQNQHQDSPQSYRPLCLCLRARRPRSVGHPHTSVHRFGHIQARRVRRGCSCIIYSPAGPAIPQGQRSRGPGLGELLLRAVTWVCEMYDTNVSGFSHAGYVP